MIQPFIFGKTPAHGDFVARGLAEDARVAWDEVGSELVAYARDRLGAEFESAHGTGPAWRFVTEPSVLGRGWLAGSATPSVDAAGRRFVLVAGLQGLSATQAAEAGAAAAAAAEAALYQALEQTWDADRLSRSVLEEGSAVLDRAPGASVAASGWWAVGAEGCVVFSDEGSRPPRDLLVRHALVLSRAPEEV